MEKSTKIIIGVIVFGVILPIAVIFPITYQQDKDAQNIAGIRDYKKGNYNAAIQELGTYLRVHPFPEKHHSQLAGTPQYAQQYLGLALLKQHRYAEAVSVFRVYAKYEAGDDESDYLLGVALKKNGNTKEARAEFQKVIDIEMNTGMSSRNQSLVNQCEKMLDQIDHPK